MKRTNRAAGFLLLSVVSFAFGCDDGGAGSHQAASQAVINRVCASYVGYRHRCDKLNGQDPAVPRASCEADPAIKLYREDALTIVAGCFDTLACDLLDDTCEGIAIQTLGKNPAQDTLHKACVTKEMMCGTFVDDICDSARVFTEDARSQISACVGKSCDEAAACIRALTR